MSKAELQGLARELSPATRDLARLTDKAIELLPETDLASKCASRVVLPTGDVVIKDEFETGRENYKDFFYAMVGLAGEGQNFDGNGMYVRFQTGGGSQQVSLGQGSAGSPPQFGGLPTPPLGQPPVLPGQAPALQVQRALPHAEAARPQRPRRRQGRAEPGRRHGEQHGARRPAADAARQDPPVRLQAGGVAMTAIRKHLVDFLAILGLVIIAFAVSTVILANQRMTLPGWFPVLGQNFTEVDAELSTAQAVTPGQGQTVNVAGVEVGEISRVRLEDGKAIVTLKLEEGSVPVYKNASVLLRPKTGLKDMVAELTPGTKDAGELEDGQRIPIGQTLPDVNLDEILSVLDGDTRSYLQLLLSDGAQGLEGNGRELANTIRRFEPLARDTRAIAEELAKRRENIKRAIHNFSLVVDELGGKDDQLAEFVENSNAVFASLASQDANLRATLQELPLDADGDADRAGQGAGARRRARPDAAGAAPGRPRARPDAAADAPVPAHDDADHQGRDQALRARLAPAREGAAAGDARPLGAHARPAAQLQGRQHAAQHARLQPARRHRGGVPLLGLVGQPPRARDLLQPGRPRPDPARSRGRRLPEPADPREHRARQPAARRAHPAARGARSRRRLPEVRADAAGGFRARTPGAAPSRATSKSRPQLRPDRRDGRLRAVVLRAAAVPVARVRRLDPAQAEGLPGRRLVRRGLAARDGGRRADLRRARSARSRRSSPTPRRAARW